MIHIVICDDNAEYRETLEDFCRRYFAGKQEISAVSYASGQELIDAMKKKKAAADLALLDIEMEGMDGIEVKKYLEKSRDTLILFVTSHERYMPQAFGYQVVGFLKKPVQFCDFAEKMRELTGILEQKHESVLVKNRMGEKKILLREIDYIRADGKYAKFFLKGDAKGATFIEYQSYGYWKEKLSGSDFWEAKKGCLINLGNVEALESGDIVFEDGKKIVCSVRRRTEMKRRFEAYIDEHAR